MMRILCTTLFACFILNISLAQQDSLTGQPFNPPKKPDISSMATRNVADIQAVISTVEQNVEPEAVNFNGSRGRGVRVVQYSEINIPLEQIQTKTTTTKFKQTPKKKVSKSKKRKRTRGRLYAYKPRRGLFAHCPSF